MTGVLMLFLIPVGGGIPAGVLLAQNLHLTWPVTAGLYCVSDVILAFAFEPVMLGAAALAKRRPGAAKVVDVFRQAVRRTTGHYGGAGPLTLVMIAFGVDPMTGRAATAAAGHGFVTGWAIAITGDMMYFGVVMAATLRVNSILGDPNRTVIAVLLGMFLLPVIVRKIKSALHRTPSARTIS